MRLFNFSSLSAQIVLSLVCLDVVSAASVPWPQNDNFRRSNLSSDSLPSSNNHGGSGGGSSNNNNDRDLDGIRQLVQRQLPEHAQSSFEFSFMEGSGDSFVVSDARHGQGVSISCTTASACARGLYTYLKEVGGVDIYWTGSRLNELAYPIPKVGNPITGNSIVEYRYYFNTVTFSYTTAFYDLDQWYALLDWMALKGMNVPLAWVGFEFLYMQTLKQIGMTEDDIIPFFTPPAFQAWNRFGNIQGSWGGSNLPIQWINDQFALQKNIVARMVELGMTPILPSFTGFVPCPLSKLYPNVNIVQSPDCFLSPSEPLFAEIQKLFIQNQKAAYGDVSSMYTLDQYNENNPVSGDVSYLHNISAFTFNSLREADPKATWVMQGWLFFSSEDFWTLDRISAYLGGVSDPQGMLILDLYSEAQPQWQRTSSYEGRPWIWCQLHDFGQNQGFEGHLLNLTASPLEALHASGSTMKGIGLTMEGQEGNQIVYDILLDQAWSHSAISIPDYVSSWVSRRYQIASSSSNSRSNNEENNEASKDVQSAWTILSNTVYNNADPNTQATVKSILELAPALSGLVNRTGHHPTELFYNTDTTILPALKSLVQAKSRDAKLGSVPEFAYDVVDLSRQLLANRFQDAYLTLVEQFNSSSSSSHHSTSTSTAAIVKSLTATAQTMSNILTILDELLYTNPNFLLSTWISSAKNWAHGNTTYSKFLEYNARNQITLWGPDGENGDYASKQWAGLVGTYYLPRWEMFTDYLIDTKRENKEFNGTAISAEILNFGVGWDDRTFGENDGEYFGTRGDTWEVVDKVLELYG